MMCRGLGTGLSITRDAVSPRRRLSLSDLEESNRRHTINSSGRRTGSGLTLAELERMNADEYPSPREVYRRETAQLAAMNKTQQSFHEKRRAEELKKMGITA